VVLETAAAITGGPLAGLRAADVVRVAPVASAVVPVAVVALADAVPAAPAVVPAAVAPAGPAASA
jgi:hypothetical protein